MTLRQTGEFERIERIFAPLADAWPGALGLRDDAALVVPSAGCEIVVTMDTVVAGVHFVGDEPAEFIAAKLLRVNLSDLAAMGARPLVYTLSIALPKSVGDDWLERFAQGLAADQKTFGVALAGGDSVATPGPMTLTITALGEVALGKSLHRAGARSGDGVYVTGTIGDATLGLRAVRGGLPDLAPSDRMALIQRYQCPEPRLAVGQALVGLASAAVDVSDGLVADLQHLAAASEVSATVKAAAVPLSPAVSKMIENKPDLMEAVLTGGDDYELLLTAPANAGAKLGGLAATLGVPIARIGEVAEGSGVRVVDASGRNIEIQKPGYTHG
ncbi:MAG: thiamine-phosphate kinase [Alphaproteobacteria bacterium]|nr:thiamine-phosphate kinase [Alphaproteobacteria bacterium]